MVAGFFCSRGEGLVCEALNHQVCIRREWGFSGSESSVWVWSLVDALLPCVEIRHGSGILCKPELVCWFEDNRKSVGFCVFVLNSDLWVYEFSGVVLRSSSSCVDVHNTLQDCTNKIKKFVFPLNYEEESTHIHVPFAHGTDVCMSGLEFLRVKDGYAYIIVAFENCTFKSLQISLDTKIDDINITWSDEWIPTLKTYSSPNMMTTDNTLYTPSHNPGWLKTFLVSTTKTEKPNNNTKICMGSFRHFIILKDNFTVISVCENCVQVFQVGDGLTTTGLTQTESFFEICGLKITKMVLSSSIPDNNCDKGIVLAVSKENYKKTFIMPVSINLGESGYYLDIDYRNKTFFVHNVPDEEFYVAPSASGFVIVNSRSLNSWEVKHSRFHEIVANPIDLDVRVGCVGISSQVYDCNINIAQRVVHISSVMDYSTKPLKCPTCIMVLGCGIIYNRHIGFFGPYNEGKIDMDFWGPQFHTTFESFLHRQPLLTFQNGKLLQNVDLTQQKNLNCFVDFLEQIHVKDILYMVDFLKYINLYNFVPMKTRLKLAGRHEKIIASNAIQDLLKSQYHNCELAQISNSFQKLIWEYLYSRTNTSQNGQPFIAESNSIVFELTSQVSSERDLVEKTLPILYIFNTYFKTVADVRIQYARTFELEIEQYIRTQKKNSTNITNNKLLLLLCQNAWKFQKPMWIMSKDCDYEEEEEEEGSSPYQACVELLDAVAQLTSFFAFRENKQRTTSTSTTTTTCESKDVLPLLALAFKIANQLIFLCEEAHHIRGEILHRMVIIEPLLLHFRASDRNKNPSTAETLALFPHETYQLALKLRHIPTLTYLMCKPDTTSTKNEPLLYSESLLYFWKVLLEDEGMRSDFFDYLPTSPFHLWILKMPYSLTQHAVLHFRELPSILWILLIRLCSQKKTSTSSVPSSITKPDHQNFWISVAKQYTLDFSRPQDLLQPKQPSTPSVFETVQLLLGAIGLTTDQGGEFYLSAASIFCRGSDTYLKRDLKTRAILQDLSETFKMKAHCTQLSEEIIVVYALQQIKLLPIATLQEVEARREMLRNVSFLFEQLDNPSGFLKEFWMVVLETDRKIWNHLNMCSAGVELAKAMFLTLHTLVYELLMRRGLAGSELVEASKELGCSEFVTYCVEEWERSSSSSSSTNFSV